MRIALAQINPIVGDIAGNCELIVRELDRATAQGADLVVFPELAITGYPPKDLLLKPDFVRRNVAAVEQLATQCQEVVAIIGFAQPVVDGDMRRMHNAAAVCANGRVLHTHAKKLLPTYDVFDETRYFAPGENSTVETLTLGGRAVRVGFSICEDLWSHELIGGHRRYSADPLGALAKQGAELLVNLSASPFSVGKPGRRRDIFKEQVLRLGLPLVYVNQVGGNDDLIFDGGSAYFSADGVVQAQAKYFASDLLVCDTHALSDARRETLPDDLASVRQALVLGTRDYVRKCGFKDVVVGLSGGIDSAVTAAIATQALGAERVHGVAMPSRFSSAHSLADAEQLAKNLGIDYRVIAIEDCHTAFEKVLAPHFGDRPADVAEENIQARTRGNLLMALSNKFGWLLLTTGNKSEMAVGYCTLYGDMSGGLAVISDVPKTMVYALARRMNAAAGRAVIPESTLSKAPSAELRENQTDQDSLPPYDVLDAILAEYVEGEASVEELTRKGFDATTVARVARLVDRNEYKRKQAATGLKVTSRAFGSGRRMPIAARYE
ncbi:MAG: NAD+ synthase [Phycisphaerales bacterium]|nr:NAD+ synthase [Phycisphaerales bacterium]